MGIKTNTMTLTELQTEAHAQVRKLANRYGFAHYDIYLTFRKRDREVTSTYKDVIQFFCEEYELTENKLFSFDRHSGVVIPRQMVQYCMRQFCGLTYANIGKLTGRDHATVLHSCKLIKNMMETNRKFNEEMQSNIERLLI